MTSPRPGLRGDLPNPRRRLPRLGEPPTKKKVAAPQKTKHTVYLATTTAERMKDAAVALSSTPGAPASLSALVEEAVLEKLNQLEQQYNHGSPFPARYREPRPGRPIT